jgi:hypothetical protein
VGGPGNDVVAGGLGSDNVVGEEGNDWVADGEDPGISEDFISGDAGNDVVESAQRPAFKDIVTCGGGFDWVFGDKKDTIAPDCERVADRPSEFDALYESIPESFWEGLPPQPQQVRSLSPQG